MSRVVLSRNCGMKARDGVWLATDIWRPADDAGEPLAGRFPAVVVRSPYGRRSESHEALGEFWARNGFLGVVQDVRGRFDSEGDFVLLADEGPDGFDTIEWVASLEWCDGNVGTYGTSYLAWVQNAAALERPPHLRAMWVNQGGANGNTSALRHNGALELRWLTWAVTHGAVAPEATRDPALAAELSAAGERMYEWLERLPWHQGNSPLAGLSGYESWARDLYEKGDADDVYWRQKGLNFAAHYERSADVPTVYLGSWYDSYTRATTENYEALSTRLGHQRLVMGPWTHGEQTLDRCYSGEVDLGPQAPIARSSGGTRLHLARRWFDRWLRGERNGVDEEAPVRLFVMGGGDGGRTAEGRLQHGGCWREEQEWPLARARPTGLYLHPGESMCVDGPPERPASRSFVFDPADPLPTIAANTSSLNEIVPTPARLELATPIDLMRVMVIQGGADQRTRPDLHGCRPPYGPLEERHDVLAFRLGPLEEDLEITGPLEAVLFLSSDAPDTDLFVMLEDVYPPSADWPAGFRLNVADGLMRVRYRQGMHRPSRMEPGVVYEVRFPLYPTSNLFVGGHSIQVLVSSSSFPRFDVNPNTGEPIGRHTSTRVARNTLHFSSEHPSRLVVPVVPRASGSDRGPVP